MLVLLEPVNLQIQDTQSALKHAVVNHRVQCEYC